MARKKVNRKANENSNGQQIHSETAPVTFQKPAELSRQSSMEDHDSSEEKIQNLKSLNSMLLKQTMEKRHQIESLVQAKDALEDEFSRSSDENLGLKLEMGLVMAFVESRVGELGVGVNGLVSEKSDRECEIRDLKREAEGMMCKLESERKELVRVCDERDSIKNRFDLQSKETNRLKETVARLEMKETSLGEEISKLKSENDRMMKEKGKREEMIERVNEKKTDLEKKLEGRIKEIDELKSEITGFVSYKMEIEVVNGDQKEKIMELEKNIEKLNEIVQRLTKEEESLLSQVIELEKAIASSMEKAEAREEHIDALMKEKATKESELESLLMEKNSIKKQMEMEIAQSSNKEKVINQLLREKNDLYDRVVKQEAEIIELNKQIDELKQVAAQLQKDYNDQTNTSEKLNHKVTEIKDAMTLIEVERDNAGKALKEEKRNQVALSEKVIKLEKTVESDVKELEKIKIERGRLIREKKELENQAKSLKNEKGTLEKDMTELKRGVAVLETKLESAGTNANRGLTMLKSVSSLVCGSENQKGDKKPEKGSDFYSVELEAIKKAFKKRENMVEEMKKEVEIMKNSVEDAEKKKSFWTLVSSVTTLFMAASVAYAASIR